MLIWAALSPTTIGKGRIVSQPVVHFEIACKDADAQQAFYEKVLDWDFQIHQPMNYRMVSPSEEEERIPAISGGLFAGPEGRSYVTVYAQVDDLQAYLDKAEANGGKVVLGPTDVGEGMGSVGMFIDPEGNPFGLYQPSAES